MPFWTRTNASVGSILEYFWFSKAPFWAPRFKGPLSCRSVGLLTPWVFASWLALLKLLMTLRFVAANRSLTVFHTLFHPSIVAVWHPARGERIGETQNAGPRHRHFAIAFASPIQRVLPTNMTITIRMLVTMGLMCLQPQKLLLHFGPSKHSPPT